MPPLRPYQQRAVDEARQAFASGARSCLVVAPTGAGKGTIAAHLLRSVLERGKRAVFVVHRGEIMGDVGQRLARDGITDLGFIKAGSSRGRASAPVQLCTVQTLTARAHERPPADLIITDEAHHAVASTYRAVYAAYPKALHLGLTATPERSDGTALGDVFDRLVVAATVPQLQREGHLVECDVVAPESAQSGLAEHPVEAWMRHCPGRRTFLFAASVDEAHELAAQFKAQAIPAAAIDGSTPPEERQRILRALATGELLVVVNVFVLTEGVDVPSAEVCMLARGCESAATFLQMVGRVLRPSPATGKERALLVDLRGVVHAHGLPSEERVFSLEGKAIREASPKQALRQCPACGAVFRPAPVCPRCSAPMPKPAPSVVKAAPLVAGVDVVPLSVKRARFDELVGVMRQRGYAPGWVGVRFKEEFGSWPRWFIPGFQRRAGT